MLLFAEEEAYHCLAALVGSKEKVFIKQTKLQHEVTWKTVMQIAKKHSVSPGPHNKFHNGSSSYETIL